MEVLGRWRRMINKGLSKREFRVAQAWRKIFIKLGR